MPAVEQAFNRRQFLILVCFHPGKVHALNCNEFSKINVALCLLEATHLSFPNDSQISTHTLNKLLNEVHNYSHWWQWYQRNQENILLGPVSCRLYICRTIVTCRAERDLRHYLTHNLIASDRKKVFFESQIN
ncbi:hypothetical protein mRhiFer1_009451 [Rhinolophus ferrumequinum]|uniref:Uncharacterized protein n=1 Tax=Rhinolophus ferrumequinum TaxID=59479 RepID=A0A7J7RIX8_RHIFE|nr:hypothetical protein mRhiFer1_009451 [Rhinolophus ferrumequinum]